MMRYIFQMLSAVEAAAAAVMECVSKKSEQEYHVSVIPDGQALTAVLISMNATVTHVRMAELVLMERICLHVPVLQPGQD